MTTSKYKTPDAFLSALTQRLRTISEKEGIDIPRLRKQIAFDRLLARLIETPDNLWVLKGGYSLELHFQLSRATKDIDLSIQAPELLKEDKDKRAEIIHFRLVEESQRDLGDFFSFLVKAPSFDLAGPPEGGARYGVEAQVDSKVFAKFNIDVVIGEHLVQPLAKTSGKNWLEFAGIPSTEIPTYSFEQHFADKIHAYTKPTRKTSRIKDFVDLILLIRSNALDSKKIKEALKVVFEHEGTHTLPVTLKPPPAEWEEGFGGLAKECNLSLNLDSAFAEVGTFIDQQGLQSDIRTS